MYCGSNLFICDVVRELVPAYAGHQRYPLLSVAVSYGVRQSLQQKTSTFEDRIPQRKSQVRHRPIDPGCLIIGEVATSQGYRCGERHIEGNRFPVQQRRQCSHFDGRAETVSEVDASLEFRFPKVRLKFFQHEVNRFGQNPFGSGFEGGGGSPEPILQDIPTDALECDEKIL
jgi:hypothetical protein